MQLLSPSKTPTVSTSATAHDAAEAKAKAVAAKFVEFTARIETFKLAKQTVSEKQQAAVSEALEEVMTEMLEYNRSLRAASAE